MSGEIGGGWPDLYEITLVDGKITAIRENEITEKDFRPYTGMLYGQEMRGPIEVNGKDYLVLDGYRIPLEEARATELKEQPVRHGGSRPVRGNRGGRRGDHDPGILICGERIGPSWELRS